MESRKFDQEKLRLDLLEPEFERGIAAVLTFGAQKYEEESWKTLSNARKRYIGALLRHLNAYRSGELNDSETGLSHLYHAACNLMFLDYIDRNTKQYGLSEKALRDMISEAKGEK